MGAWNGAGASYGRWFREDELLRLAMDFLDQSAHDWNRGAGRSHFSEY